MSEFDQKELEEIVKKFISINETIENMKKTPIQSEEDFINNLVMLKEKLESMQREHPEFMEKASQYKNEDN